MYFISYQHMSWHLMAIGCLKAWPTTKPSFEFSCWKLSLPTLVEPLLMPVPRDGKAVPVVLLCLLRKWHDFLFSPPDSFSPHSSLLSLSLFFHLHSNLHELLSCLWENWNLSFPFPHPPTAPAFTCASVSSGQRGDLKCQENLWKPPLL